MTLELFNTIVGLISLVLALFATSKVIKLQNYVKSSNNSGNHSPIVNPTQTVTGNGNVTSGKNSNL